MSLAHQVSDLRALLALRDTRMYLAGQMLSAAGDNSLWLAMGIWVKMLTGSNTDAGLALFPFTCGLLLAPAAGLAADRFRRARLLTAVNIAAAAGVCALLAVRGPGQIWLIWIVMFCYGAASTLIVSAQTALLAVLVPATLLGQANALLQMASQGLRVITPLIGAGLLTWAGPRPLILVDASTFAVAAGCAATLQAREGKPGPRSADWLSEVTAGFRYIAGHAGLRRMLTAAAITLAAFGFSSAVLFAVTSQGLHKSPAYLGVLFSGMGAGALAGGLAAPAAIRKTSPATAVALGLTAAAAGCLLLTTEWPPVIITAMALLGLAVVWLNAGATTLIQLQAPPALTGRVDAALSMAITIPQAASIAIGAALITVIPYRILLTTMAAMITTAICCLRPRSRHPDFKPGRPGAASRLMQRGKSSPDH